jgi:hypothetical protein
MHWPAGGCGDCAPSYMKAEAGINSFCSDAAIRTDYGSLHPALCGQAWLSQLFAKKFSISYRTCHQRFPAPMHSRRYLLKIMGRR